MKTASQFLIVITALLLSFNSAIYGQTVHTVKLYVNTAEIQHPNVNNYCNFGQTDGSSNEEYTIEVEVGDIIIWEGISTSSVTDVVNMNFINFQGGTNIFGQNILKGNGEVPELIVGKALYTTIGKDKEDYKYQLFFTVLNNGEKRNGIFQIDPKIRVDQ
jgi:hypothetical protein